MTLLKADVCILNVQNVRSCRRPFALVVWRFTQVAFLATISSVAFPERVPCTVRSFLVFFLGSRFGPFDELGVALPPNLHLSVVDYPAYHMIYERFLMSSAGPTLFPAVSQLWCGTLVW